MVEIDGIEWWTREEVAAHCGVEPDTIGGYRARGQMPTPTYVGRTPMWRKDEIETWHAGRRGQGWRGQSGPRTPDA